MRDRDAERIRESLDDPRGLCDALGLLDGRRGVHWQTQTAGVMIRCPFDHDEKTPSCSVTRVRDGVLVRCFGCGASADGLGLVAAAHRLDIRHDYARVLEIAADLAGVRRPERLDGYVSPPAPPMVRRALPVPTEAPEDGSVDAVASVLADLAPVTRDRAAMEYLRSRGLARSVALGWYALPADEGARERLRDAVIDRVGPAPWASSGLASAEGPREGLWSYAWHGPRLVIPWRAPNGTAESLQGRFLGDAPKGVRKYVFPRGRRPRWPFGADALDLVGADTAVAVVEGAIDGVSFDLLARSAGVDAVALAIPGVSAWDARWLRLFARRPCIVALDRDRAGDAAMAEMAARLGAVARRGPRGPMVSVRRPSCGKDWNDALCARAEVA